MHHRHTFVDAQVNLRFFRNIFNVCIRTMKYLSKGVIILLFALFGQSGKPLKTKLGWAAAVVCTVRTTAMLPSVMGLVHQFS